MPTIAQPGDVVLVRFPFTDLTTTKLRPAVVLATHGDDVTIVGIFSSSPHPSRQTWVVLSNLDPAFHETGLKTTSVIKAERIAVIEKSIVVRKLGSLSTPQMREVKRAVKLSKLPSAKTVPKVVRLGSGWTASSIARPWPPCPGKRSSAASAGSPLRQCAG